MAPPDDTMSPCQTYAIISYALLPYARHGHVTTRDEVFMLFRCLPYAAMLIFAAY